MTILQSEYNSTVGGTCLFLASCWTPTATPCATADWCQGGWTGRWIYISYIFDISWLPRSARAFPQRELGRFGLACNPILYARRWMSSTSTPFSLVFRLNSWYCHGKNVDGSDLIYRMHSPFRRHRPFLFVCCILCFSSSLPSFRNIVPLPNRRKRHVRIPATL